jgi:hypothetical protein
MITIPIMGEISREEYDLIRKANEIELRERAKIESDMFTDYDFINADKTNLRTIRY